MLVEVAVGVLILGAAGFSLWMLRRRKSMLQERVLRYRAVEKYVDEEEE